MLLGVGAQIGEDRWSRLANTAEEMRAEDVTPEALAGGGITDKGAEIDARGDLEQDIPWQRPRYRGLVLRQRTCVFLSAFP
jgi:hypothetical protein